VSFGSWGFKSLRPHSDNGSVYAKRHRLALLLAAAAALGAAGSATGTEGESVASTNWSGYVIDGGPFAVVKATFNVPNLTAAPGTAMTCEWVGVDGTGPADRSLIQAGVTEKFDPRANLVRFHAWWEVLPALETVVPLAVTAGDRITVSIGRISGRKWQIEIADLTRGRRFVTTQPYAGSGRTADWVVEAPSDRFGNVQTLGHYVPDVVFSNVRLAGAQHEFHAMTMVQHGAVVSHVSRLTPGGFSASYGSG
jgi:hypothetical protein